MQIEPNEADGVTFRYRTSTGIERTVEMSDQLVLELVPDTHEVTPADIARAITRYADGRKAIEGFVSRAVVRLARAGKVVTEVREAHELAIRHRSGTIVPRVRFVRRPGVAIADR